MFIFFFQIIVSAQGKPDKAPDNEDGTKSVLCGGVERWVVKVLADAGAAQVNYTPKLTTIDSLIHIPTTPDQNAQRMAGIEFQSYVFTCNITIKKNEDDDDYHLVIKSGSETKIGEVPDPACASVAISAHVNEFMAARNWVNQHIGTNAVPNVTIAPVDITGVSFVDPPHGQTGRRVKYLDIPVTNKKEINYKFSRSGLTGGLYIYRIRNNGSILYEGKIIVR